MNTALPRGRHRWLTNPSTLVAPTGVLLGLAYVANVVPIERPLWTSYLVLLTLVSVVFALTADVWEQSRLKTIKGLGDGTLGITPDTLAAAAKEAAQAPDTTFFLALFSFVAGSIVLALGWWLWASPPVIVVVRIACVGLLVSPLTALLGNLMLIPRSRQVLRELQAAGASTAALAAALPARYALRRRLIIYAAIAVLTPMLLVADVGLHRAHELLSLVSAEKDVAAARLALDAHDASGLWPMLLLGVVTLLMVLACGWLSGTALGAPLRGLGAETERLVQGRYARDRLVMAEHETWAAATALSSMETTLLEGVQGAREASSGVRDAADELVMNGILQEQGAAEQSAALMATTATTEELARSARQISANAQAVSEIARGTLTAAQAGKANAESFTAAMSEVRGGNQAIADSVVKLNKRVQQVGRIIEFIDGIADKSDLLALNAELEGHKAGDVGQGFGLVAAEMRRLAENVMTSTREIARLIDDIRDATNAAVMATEAGVKATDTGAGLAANVSDALSNIVEFANLSSDAMQSISLATAQQQAGSDQLVSAMEDINRSTQRNVSGALEMKSTQTDLVTVSRELEAVVETFGGKA